jgi:hypothetical protein
LIRVRTMAMQFSQFAQGVLEARQRNS